MAQKQKDQGWIAACVILVLVFCAGRYTAPAASLPQVSTVTPATQPIASFPTADEPVARPVSAPAPAPESFDTVPESATPSSEEPVDVYYANCSEARAAGAAPIREGEPGYAPHLDRDRDGVACE